MEDIIKLQSREDVNNYLKKMKRVDGSESKTYMIKTNSPHLKSGYVDGNKKFIELFRGPIMIEGVYSPEANAVVESIDWIDGRGYTITFK